MLAKVFNDGSQAHLMDLRWGPQILRKSTFAMEQYISTARDLIDHLMAIGDHLGDREQVLYVPGGLDVNYISIVTNIT